ncbi:MAG: methyltransferase [Alphaproteobacteria bacterium]|nr:methyltransferase [Alphaproteobacteria bacterium]
MGIIEFTEDLILNGKIKLCQPKHGYRIAIDPILLASVVELKNEQTILDAGCGVGAMSLILKYMNNSQNITSVDIDPTMTELCKRNSELNNLPLNIINGPIGTNLLRNEIFDSVVTNPPFYNPENFRSSEKKFAANFETISLKSWISFCLKRLKPNGNFYIIHLPERLGYILESFRDLVGKIEILPIYSHQKEPAKRIIVKCKKASKEPLKVLSGLTSHEDNNEYTDSLKSILSGNFSETDWIKIR